MRLTFLGTGTSHGVPMIGCRCPVCTSTDPRNHRRRASILVEWRETVIVVDTGPEFRLQVIDANVTRLDAVLLTHAHSDHVMGLDDVRAFNLKQSSTMPVYGSAETLAEVRHRFAYAFREGPLGGGKPQLALCTVDGPFTVGDIEAVPLELRHGPGRVTAYRFAPRDSGGPAFAYATDTNGVPDEAVQALGGLDLLVLDALGPGPHPTHFSLPEAVAMAHRIGARRTLFTHMSHALDHEATDTSLPHGMALAFDRQVVQVGG
jgi:phosphoribosyl 1,2-cyclic phosphate phosphodiesterase